MSESTRTRSLDDILTSGAAWITESELQMIGDRLRQANKTLRAIVEMIDDCPDATTSSDSLPQAIRFYADGALRGVDTGVM